MQGLDYRRDGTSSERGFVLKGEHSITEGFGVLREGADAERDGGNFKNGIPSIWPRLPIHSSPVELYAGVKWISGFYRRRHQSLSEACFDPLTSYLQVERSA